MIGTVEFIRCAGSLATGEHVLPSSDSEMDTYVVKVYSGVQFVEDMQQTVTMPSFDGWSECNMVRLTQTNQTEGKPAWKAYYWITDAVRSSDVTGSTIFNLEFNPVTTMLKKGDSIKGQWIRSPTNYTPWKQQNVISGTMAYTDKKKNLAVCEYGVYKLGWLSITTTHDIITGNPSYGLNVIGIPIVYSGSTLLSYHTRMVDNNNTSKVFPNLNDIINDPFDNIGLTAAEILDISMTDVIPFNYTVTGFDSGHLKIQLQSESGVFVATPLQCRYHDGDEAKYSTYYMFDISTSGIVPITYVDDLTITDKELACGSINIRDRNGSVIANIPSGWFSNNTIRVVTECVVDVCQIYKRLKIYSYGSSVPCTTLITTEAHLPFTGSQWDSYRAYAMSYDREAMEFSIDQAKRQAMTNVIDATISTATGLATAGASYAAQNAVRVAAGANTAQMNAAEVSYGQQRSFIQSQGTQGIFGSITAYITAEKSARFTQNLTERRTQAQPGNAYSTQYGLSYIMNQLDTPTCVIVSMVPGLTDDIFNEFIENFGYANEGEYTQTMQYGYYQGTVFTSPTMTGPRFDSLINFFNAGVRLIPPTGNE